MSAQFWNEVYADQKPIVVDGWIRSLSSDCGVLDTCEDARCPAVRVGTFEDYQRYHTNPVDLLSAWEHQELKYKLASL